MFHIRRLVYMFCLLAVFAVACSSPSALPTKSNSDQNFAVVTVSPTPTLIPTSTSVPSQEPKSAVIQLREGLSSSACHLPVVVVPTPAPIPEGLNDVDPSTGLHLTGIAVTLDITSYRLSITGKVDHPLELSYDEIRCLPKVEANIPLVCPGVFTDIATWAGTPLESVLALAGVQDGAKSMLMVSADSYQTQVDLAEALAARAFLAYELAGQTLPILHGFPIRAVFPGLDGNKWVKWLVEIEIL